MRKGELKEDGREKKAIFDIQNQPSRRQKNGRSYRKRNFDLVLS
jgi:hypothetical protein